MSRLRFLFSPRLIGAGLLLSILPSAASAQVSVVTHHNDNARTGQNLQEKILNTSNVNINTFGKLFERSVDWKIWSQPLYLANVNIPGKGLRNVVYVQTETGNFYAFDADNAAETAPLWQRWQVEANHTNDLSVGTPVIDAATKTIYSTVRVKYGNAPQFWLYALDAATGANKVAPVQITGTVPGTGKGSSGGQMTLLPPSQKQRPALLLMNGTIYIGFGGSVDEFNPDSMWNGWVFAYDAKTLQRKALICIAPNANGGGIWQAGNGLAGDAQGNVYAVTGNGNGAPSAFDANTGGKDHGDSILKLSPSLTISSWFTPYNFAYMETADQDVGASGPLLVPGTTWLVTGDKMGRLYVVNKDNMGGFRAGSNGQIVQDFQAWNGHLHGGPIYWNSPTLGPLIYGWAEHDYLKAYSKATAGFNTTPKLKSKVSVPPGMPGGFLSLTANGTTGGTAIVWANTPYIGDANKGEVPGALHAFDATDLTKELWNSQQMPERDDFGLFAKFTPPTVANGKVYLATFSNKLVVYGLLPKTALPAVPTKLTATAGIYKNTLSWTASSGAISYTVKRGTASGGPYATIASSVRATSYEDKDVTPGTAYYYVVSAANAGGQSANSNQASAMPFAPSAGSVLSVDFVGASTVTGTPSPMGSGEIAGAIPVANWNAASGASGTLSNLFANGGTGTTAKITWKASAANSTSIAETAGNARMMKGYVYSDNNANTTVTISGLPATFTSAGFDVLVYTDGLNPSSTKTGTFKIGTQAVTVADSQNRDFEGSFIPPGVANVGNYAVLSNLNTASLTLTITNSASTDSARRTPINGIQIVAHQSSGISAPAAPVLVGRPGNTQTILSWNAVPGAQRYSLKRGTAAAGPFAIIQANLTGTGYADPQVQNGRTYYYVVTAIGAGGESPNSNVVAIAPSSSYVGRVISIDFSGSSTGIMGRSEVAGSDGVARKCWNVARYVSGSKTKLLDDLARATTAAATWKGGALGDTTIADTAGQNRMMRGYLQPKGTTLVTVTVSGLTADYTSPGYDVYVYFDTNNPNANRQGRYTIDTATTTATDARGVNFTGTFTNANGGSGNFVKLLGFTASSFTLTGTPLSSDDGVPGGTISAVQIVARNSAGTAAQKTSTTVAMLDNGTLGSG